MEIKQINNIQSLIELRKVFLSELVSISEDEWSLLKKQLTIYFEKHIANDNFIAFGYNIGDKIVSCAFLVIEERPAAPGCPNGQIGTILNVYTYPSYRLKGYGEAVMNSLIEEAHNRGISVLDLSATEAGLRLYEKLGFKPSHYTNMRLQ